MTNNPYQIKHFHFIGIGGIGMSGLAMVLRQRGFAVSGSDKSNNPSINNLKDLGINIFKEQAASNISQLSEDKNEQLIIVISSAIRQENEELKEAYEKNLKILHRSDILAFLIKQQYSILIAGSHGKTTTSTIITTILGKANQDPTAIIGGIVPYYNSNAYVGKGKFLIAEADESDGSLTKYDGDIGLLTNIELDHTDYYTNIDSLINTIKKFTKNCKKIVANYDCNNLRKACPDKTIWWSTNEFKNINFAAIPKIMNGQITLASYYENGKYIDDISISLPGVHNLNNTLGAIAACRSADINFSDIKPHVSSLKCPERRFQFKGIWKGRQIVDDYAHHPSEIRETLSMARLMINTKKSILPMAADRIVVIFQPHRYSRTRDLITEFAKNLGAADLVILTPIYSAGEEPIKGITSEKLKSCTLANNPNLPIFTCKQLRDLENIINLKTRENDLLLFMGAGDITKVSEKLSKKIK
ncbi:MULTISPECIES: UDP-N-acetylmuramate--L-alanine ligase [Prochlorococcus]|uniref:UDP-N-acetylmuramate--L-alanine ligase n=1 Tax=Prochlorococcus marinus (strain SARG / CCMP1375 / SS120) TaxID=167539 RepID=MURC_PROMA|nr:MULTISPECIES: UDP-N-acetylmuramate--L-alanine ligase [Prochlorococcus]Q7VEJ1.1 RecName: Full=UDP-N-acetylmuramate--L-alanine ligase; AltName: Full=UDP-N-acetylmuramoyl-L-alanine synthetase [Prochlorococcus marinus subsp. marinus str. CCMP1375]AAP99068.1 UDP-N-acetylmuramate-alanine ligase [Prochlorococcus marinus subsp. marinus str. CCMP1375]